MFTPDAIDEALRALGELLRDRDERIAVVAIGGGGLLLLGITTRPTKDLDLVAVLDAHGMISAEPLPPALQRAAVEVAHVLGLADDWLNAGPTSLLRFGLPDGFLGRAAVRDYGGLVVHLASRFDQIHFKLFAAADDRPGGKHHVDLVRLQPTAEELRQALAWASTHDPSDAFRTLAVQVLAAFGAEP